LSGAGDLIGGDGLGEIGGEDERGDDRRKGRIGPVIKAPTDDPAVLSFSAPLAPVMVQVP